MGRAYDWDRENEYIRDGGRTQAPAPRPPRRTSSAAARRRAARRRRNRWIAAALFFALVLLIWRPWRAPAPDADGRQEPAAVPEWVEQMLLPVNEYSRPGTKLDAVHGVVVHYTGNPGTSAQQNRNYFGQLAQTHETYASSHFVIGIDGKVIQCVPLDEVAYCSNNRNSDTISIECCHSDETGQFSQETLDSLVKLLNWLIDVYDLEREDILRHYDVTGKECPRYFVTHPEEWELFLDGLDLS